MRLIDFPLMHDAGLLSPVEAKCINQFELCFGLKLPDELREFYLEASGTEDFTELSWRVLPFEELEALHRRVKSAVDYSLYDGQEPILFGDYVPFMDCLIELPLYAVCCNPRSDEFKRVISITFDGGVSVYGPHGKFPGFLSTLMKHWEDGMLP